MIRTTWIAGVAVAVLTTGASAQTGACVIASDGTNPLVDLNTLYNAAADYQIVSNSNDAYTYHFNVCGSATFQDAMCTSDSMVCEVKDDAAIDVYGYATTISLARSNGYVVLTSTGLAQCPFNTANPYVTKIYFMCADETAISAKTEYYYQCLLEIEFHTPLACGGNTVNYRCDNNTLQCVQEDDGHYGSHAECESDCVPAPPPPPPPCEGNCSKYQCSSDFQCVSSETGHFTSETDCSSMCTPFSVRYSCYSGRCVRNSRGTFTSYTDCTAGCTSYSQVHKTENKWGCSSGVCTEDGNGAYGSEADCESACGSQIQYVKDE